MNSYISILFFGYSIVAGIDPFSLIANLMGNQKEKHDVMEKTYEKVANDHYNLKFTKIIYDASYREKQIPHLRLIEMEDGSEWMALGDIPHLSYFHSEEDLHNLQTWNPNDVISIQPVSELAFSHQNYFLATDLTNMSQIYVSLINSGEFPNHLKIAKNEGGRTITLTDGSNWDVSWWQSWTSRNWRNGDDVVVGRNYRTGDTFLIDAAIPSHQSISAILAKK